MGLQTDSVGKPKLNIETAKAKEFRQWIRKVALEQAGDDPKLRELVDRPQSRFGTGPRNELGGPALSSET